MKPAYLPACWDDEEEMRGLMSVLKARHVNPINYDRTVDFWRKVVERYCETQKKCVVSYEELREKLRRGNQLPAPLIKVLEEMHKKMLIVPVNELASPRQSWLDWGSSWVKSSFLMGSTVDFKTTKVVHIPTLKAQAKELLDYYRVQYEMVDCPEVVGYNELKQRCGSICSPESFDLVLDELMRQGEVHEGTSSDGERILKFKEQSARGPAKFTAADASVHDLRRTVTRLDVEIKKLEQKAKRFDDEARAAVHRGDRNAAMAALRKRNRARKDLTDKDNQCQRLTQMIEQLANSKQSREMVDVCKMSAQAYKNALERQGLTLESVDRTMDSINDAMQDANDIEEALREGVRQLPTPSGSVDEGDLEAELNDLMKEEVKKPKEKLPQLPEVPSHRIAEPGRDDVAARLRRLREGLPSS